MKGAAMKATVDLYEQVSQGDWWVCSGGRVHLYCRKEVNTG